MQEPVVKHLSYKAYIKDPDGIQDFLHSLPEDDKEYLMGRYIDSGEYVSLEYFPATKEFHVVLKSS